MTEKESQPIEEEKANVKEEAADDSLHSESNEELEQEVIEEQEETSQTEALKNEIAALQSRLLRVQADYDNFRRRSKEEREAAAKYRSQSFIESLLPIIDNFDRALLVAPEQEESKSILQGIEMVYRQLHDALKAEGVEVIETVGQTFDPNLHQAVMQVEEEGFESNQIVEELQKGYRLKDRVIRPSMVKVNA